VAKARTTSRPPADPINPYITASQTKWLDTFGRANAARFDERGFAYFIREVYDSFYPGYGESWPMYQGAIGMTYEQASARGLVLKRIDGSTLTYHDGILHHFNSAITTCYTAAKNREQLLRDFYEYRRTAISDGEKAATREYVLVAGSDPTLAARLADNLASQGIDVRRADGVVQGGHASRRPRARTSCRMHSRPDGCCATCSRSTSSSPRHSSRSRTAAARSGSATRSTT
jgi:hypothetical protein